MKNNIFGILIAVGIVCFFAGYCWQQYIAAQVSSWNNSQQKYNEAIGSFYPLDFPKREGNYIPVYFLYGVGALSCLLGVFALALPEEVKLDSENPPAHESPPAIPSARIEKLLKDDAERSRERQAEYLDKERKKQERERRAEREIEERGTREAEEVLRIIRSTEQLALFNRVTSRSFLAVRNSLDKSIGRVPAVIMWLAVSVVGVIIKLMVMKGTPC